MTSNEFDAIWVSVLVCPCPHCGHPRVDHAVLGFCPDQNYLQRLKLGLIECERCHEKVQPLPLECHHKIFEYRRKKRFSAPHAGQVIREKCITTMDEAIMLPYFFFWQGNCLKITAVTKETAGISRSSEYTARSSPIFILTVSSIAALVRPSGTQKRLSFAS